MDVDRAVVWVGFRVVVGAESGHVKYGTRFRTSSESNLFANSLK